MPPLHALVIGNTDGIGLALTKRLLQMGYTVTGVSRRAATIEHPAYRHAVHDVTASDYRARLQALLGSGAPTALCVYCAAIGEPLDFADMSVERLVFATNLMGLVDTVAAVIPAMLSAGSGHFVALSSLADEAISPVTPSYGASKAAVSSYLAGLALALRPRNVQVTNVRFGFVDTKLAKAKVRPFMITTERAVELLVRCLVARPARLTYPRLMELLVRALRWAALLRLTFR